MDNENEFGKRLDANEIISIFEQYQMRTHDEVALQADIAVVLGEVTQYRKEHTLSAGERIDFLVGKIGIECKVGGSKMEVLRQLQRYAQFDEIDELILVTTKSRHLELRGLQVNGKTINVYWVKWI